MVYEKALRKAIMTTIELEIKNIKSKTDTSLKSYETTTFL